VVAAGKVKLLRHTMAGQDILLDILSQGDFFGTLSSLGDAEYPDTAQALTQSCILNIDAERFQAILRRYPAVALRVLEIVTQRLHEAHETVHHLSAHSVESRVALILVRLADKLGKRQEEGLVIQVPLSRQELAEMSGTTLETASRVVSQFRRAGLISSGREWVAVVDRERLAAIASGEAAGLLAAG
jgi:CRP-like cAMP-binding protein